MIIKIKDIGTVVSGGTPSTTNPEYYNGDIVWFTPNDLSKQNSKYVKSGERLITKEGFKNCSATLIPPNNILLTSRAPIGILAINTCECCTNQGFKSIIVDSSKCNVEYLYYFLKTRVNQLINLGSGTTFKELSKASLENLEIDLPDKKRQDEVGLILSQLDAKIIVNNQVISELESLAKTIYDYWFLQFEFPNEDGKPYKSNGGKMIWSEELKREIPEGWKCGVISNLGKIISGGTPSTSNEENYSKCGIAWITPKDLSNTSNKYISHGERDISEKGLNSSSATLMPKGAVLLSSRAPIGYLAIALNPTLTLD